MSRAQCVWRTMYNVMSENTDTGNGPLSPERLPTLPGRQPTPEHELFIHRSWTIDKDQVVY